MHVLYAAALTNFNDTSLDKYLPKVVAVVFGESSQEQGRWLGERITAFRTSGHVDMICCPDEDDLDIVTRARNRQVRAAEIYLPTLQVPGKSGNGSQLLVMQVGPNEMELARAMFVELSPYRKVFQIEIDAENPVRTPVVVVPHMTGPRVTWTYAT